MFWVARNILHNVIADRMDEARLGWQRKSPGICFYEPVTGAIKRVAEAIVNGRRGFSTLTAGLP